MKDPSGRILQPGPAGELNLVVGFIQSWQILGSTLINESVLNNISKVVYVTSQIPRDISSM